MRGLRQRVGGQALVEYGLILLLIAVAAAMALLALGGAVAELYSLVVSSFL